MRKFSEEIARAAIAASDPYKATRDFLIKHIPSGDLTVFSIGKAAIPMMRAAEDVLGDRITSGLAVTKYGHSEGISSSLFEIIEAGHPVSDENSVLAAEKALDIAHRLNENDVLLVLLSGGGSALFEKSKISLELQRDITEKLLSRGADIRKINAVRKRLSLVKGGGLASAAYPARVITLALSDVLSDDKGVIASGITVKDTETDAFIREILKDYLPDISDDICDFLFDKSEIKINDGGYYFAGNINILCEAAEKKARELSFTVHSMSRNLTGEASLEAVRLIDSLPRLSGKHCFVFGGETVVTLKGKGKGGRNQEMALSAAIRLKDKKGICFLSVGSDGTDGPTDAAGGFADGNTYNIMKASGISPEEELSNNNSYYALASADSLIITGPTGTNVNDLTIILTDNYEE